jgi:RHS repeat-associated protein
MCLPDEDQAGALTFTQSYDPCGVVTYTDGPSQTEFGFTGEQYGESTQLLFLRARYYNPVDGRFQSRDTWNGDVNRPLSLNRWMYVEGNPANLVDPLGKNPNCIGYHGLDYQGCARERFLEMVSKNPATAGKNALTLVALFEDKELQTLWWPAAGRTVSRRLEWLLQMTRGIDNNYSPLPFQFLHSNLFGDNDCWFKDELQDNHLYNKKDKEGNLIWAQGGPSNQVGHFLTAIALTYFWYWGEDDLVLQFIIGHELLGDMGGHIPQVTTPISEEMKQNFFDAVKADELGNEGKRDELLWEILGFGGEVDANYIEFGRIGNSLPDLRLSLKGYRFAKWAGSHPDLPSASGGSWLRQNILRGRFE